MSQLPNKGALPPWTPAPAGEATKYLKNDWGKFCSIVPKTLRNWMFLTKQHLNKKMEETLLKRCFCWQSESDTSSNKKEQKKNKSIGPFCKFSHQVASDFVQRCATDTGGPVSSGWWWSRCTPTKLDVKALGDVTGDDGGGLSKLCWLPRVLATNRGKEVDWWDTNS